MKSQCAMRRASIESFPCVYVCTNMCLGCHKASEEKIGEKLCHADIQPFSTLLSLSPALSLPLPFSTLLSLAKYMSHAQNAIIVFRKCTIYPLPAHKHPATHSLPPHPHPTSSLFRLFVAFSFRLSSSSCKRHGILYDKLIARPNTIFICDEIYSSLPWVVTGRVNDLYGTYV